MTTGRINQVSTEFLKDVLHSLGGAQATPANKYTLDSHSQSTFVIKSLPKQRFHQVICSKQSLISHGLSTRFKENPRHKVPCDNARDAAAEA